MRTRFALLHVRELLLLGVPLLALVAGCAGHGMMTWAQKHVNVGVASVMILATTVVTAVGGWVFFDQTLTAGQLVAGAVVLAAIAGVEVITPLDHMATLVTFRIASWPARPALDELGARVFAIARAIDHLDALRISVGFWATDAELERFAEAVELLAAHTPETMPARRTLTILGQDA